MGQKTDQHFNFPQFYSKNMTQKTPTLGVGFFHASMFVFFLIFSFSFPFLAFSFSSFPLLLDVVKPESGPSSEVVGMFLSGSFSQKSGSGHLGSPQQGRRGVNNVTGNALLLGPLSVNGFWWL